MRTTILIMLVALASVWAEASIVVLAAAQESPVVSLEETLDWLKGRIDDRTVEVGVAR